MAARKNLSEIDWQVDRTLQRAGATTSMAIGRIVDAYVRLNNVAALQDLRMHRQRLVVGLKLRTGYDFSLPIDQIEEEIAVIEAVSKASTAPTAYEPHKGRGPANRRQLKTMLTPG
jgi:hypothetical protein